MVGSAETPRRLLGTPLAAAATAAAGRRGARPSAETGEEVVPAEPSEESGDRADNIAGAVELLIESCVALVLKEPRRREEARMRCSAIAGGFFVDGKERTRILI